MGKGNAGTGGYGAVELDDCNFHECVKLNAFESQRVLTFVPPDGMCSRAAACCCKPRLSGCVMWFAGEFVVMNYRITSDFRTPFRIFPFFELTSPYKVELIVKVRADIPETNYGLRSARLGLALFYVCCSPLIAVYVYFRMPSLVW